MADSLARKLAAFADEKRFHGKGPLCVALVVTQHARDLGLPLDPAKLLTPGGGQVLGLGKAAVQNVLERNGITRVLAAEGGRTSRGTLANMREYVAFLNELGEPTDLRAVEKFWIKKVQDFFSAKPFKIKSDPSKSLRAVVGDIIAQAVARQKASPGRNYAGAVLQHLIGAKLDCALGRGAFQHHSVDTADAPSGRFGDFHIEDVSIHVTTSPTEAVIEKCRENLNGGFRPVIVTLHRGVTVAEELASTAGFADRLDIFEAEQFIALNVYEIGKFKTDGRKTALQDLVTRYNQIVEDVETDPSLRIDLTH